MTHSKPAPETIVKINGVVTPAAHPLNVEMSTGGRRLDSATFEILVPGQQKPSSEFQNLDFKTFGQSEVEIFVKEKGKPARVVHWGKVSGYSIKHDASGEYFLIQSRQEPHHFGNALRHIPIHLPSGAIHSTAKPLMFNEEIDGQVFPNRSSKTDIADRPIFIDPESLRTDASKAYQSVTAEHWNLRQAVQFLCEWLNFNETYIFNPDIAHIDAILPNDPKLLRNHPIRYGQYLPAALDELLDPYGFGWYVALEPGARKIRLFRRGSGFKRTFLMQKPGETVDMDKTNVEAVNIGFDVTSRAINSVTILGDYEHYESTFELMPAWEEALDGSTAAELDKDAAAWATNPKLSRVWRDWVLNEAGDYERAGYPRIARLDSVFGKNEWYAHRRKFLPTIALGNDGAPLGQSGGIKVEWYNHDDLKWKPVDELGSEGRHIRILERECGIRFDGSIPPLEIMNQGAPSITSGARIRVTATIVADRRVGFRKLAGSSLIADEKELVLELPSRFKIREILKSSSNYTAVKAGTIKSSEVNDFLATTILADEILENWNQASVDGNVTLTGVALDVRQALGDPLKGVAGRNVMFSTNAAGSKFPTVVGIRLDFEHQQTTVTLDTYAREIGTL